MTDTPRDTYCTTYCNYPHYIANGRPYKHECRVIPPAALRAERSGDFDKAMEIMAADPDREKIVSPRQGVPRNSLPAVETCRQRGYVPGTLIGSAKWPRGPRCVSEILAKFVVLTSQGRKDRVRSLPQDCYVVSAEEGS